MKSRWFLFIYFLIFGQIIFLKFGLKNLIESHNIKNNIIWNYYFKLNDYNRGDGILQVKKWIYDII